MTKKEFIYRICSFFWKRKSAVILFLILNIFTLVFGFIEPFFSARLLQSLGSVIPDQILLYSFILLVIAAFERIFSRVRSEQESRLHEAITLDTQAFISEEMFLLELKNFDQKGTSFFTSRVTSDSYAVAGILSRLSSNITSSLRSFGVIIYIFVMSYIIGIYFVFCSFVLFALNFYRLKLSDKQYKEEAERSEVYSSSFSEIIRGIRDIKVLNLKKVMIDKTLQDQNNLNELRRKNRRKIWKFDDIKWFLRDVFDFCLLVLALFLMTKDLFLGANLLILYNYKFEAFHLFDSVFRFAESFVDIKRSFSRMYELMDGKRYSKEQYGTKHIKKLNGDIQFQNVVFGYLKNKTVLQGISFHIKANDTVGFVGKSGAGKSTIFQLIPKLYQIDSGKILLDGVSIQDLDESSIRENISVITQNPYLFNMTIRDNLKIVRPDATDEEMIECCKLCAFHDYVMSLQDGYDTRIGEGGVILSGGLRQRLAIARALMKKSEIILLDEATSALDNETQDFVQQSIQNISKDYTILIIAHRLSTVRNCDYIIVLDDGKIVGVGSHKELMKNNSYYKKLYQHELG